MNKTVLIIGAGASADFGYPIWSPLKEQLRALEIRSFLKEIGGLPDKEIENHERAFEEFHRFCEEHPDLTLDRIIYEIDRPKEKHINPTGHYVINIVGHLLAQCEVKVSEGLWISELQKHLVDYVAEAFRSSRSDQPRIF